jgi:hypothetical protein
MATVLNRMCDRRQALSLTAMRDGAIQQTVHIADIHILLVRCALAAAATVKCRVRTIPRSCVNGTATTTGYVPIYHWRSSIH